MTKVAAAKKCAWGTMVAIALGALGAACSSAPTSSAGDDSPRGDVAQASSADGWNAVDLVWRNEANGQHVVWNTVGSQFLGYHAVLPAVGDPQWRLETTGDFDGDGNTDYAWRHYPDGAGVIWFLKSDGTLDHFANTNPVGDPNWHIVGASDFNHDGRADLLWRNSASGQNAVWYMNGATLASSAFIQTVSTDWNLRGAGDVDGDGQPDLVWRNANSGQNAVWFMSRTNAIAIDHSAYLTTVADLAWRLDAVGDVDLDGKADLLWRNTATGQNGIWFMDGATLAGSRIFDPSVGDANWHIAGVQRRSLHGLEVAAKPGSAAYARGVRRWLVTTSFDQPTASASSVMLYGADAHRPLLFTKLREPDPSFYSKDISLRTYGEVARALDLHPFVDVRAQLVSSALEDHIALFGAFADEDTSTSTLRDGPPADGSWSACDAPLAGVVVSAFGLAKTIGLCARVAVGGTTLCAGSFAAGLLPALVCPVAAVVIGAGCAPAALSVCGLNASAASLWCCAGRDQRRWPVPTSCLPSPTSATCECRERLQGSHTTTRLGLFGPEFRCALGSYKVLADFEHQKTSVFAFGGWCREPTGSGSLTYSNTHGWSPVWDTGSWDDVPQIVPGKRHVGGGQCDSTNVNESGEVIGRRAGQPVTQGLDYVDESFTAWSNAYGEHGADHYSTKLECAGWSDVDPITHQVDPNSSFESCYRSVVSSLPHDGNGNPDWSEKPITPATCVSDTCGPVGWR